MAPTLKPSGSEVKKETILFKNLDPKNLKQNKVFLVLGPRGSGKTTVIKTLLYHMRDRFEFVVAYFGTEDTVADFKGIIPDCFMYAGTESMNPDMLTSVIKLQEGWNKMARLKNDHVGFRIKSVLVLTDDMMVHKEWLKSKAMGALHNNGRHLGMTVVNSAQYMMDLPPTLRTQTDYVIAFFNPAATWIRKLYDQFVGGLIEFPSFPTVYKKLCEGQKAMVLDNTVKTGKLTDCIRCFGADPSHTDPSFKGYSLGSDVFWQLSFMYTKREEQRLAEVQSDLDKERARIIDSKLDRFSMLRDGRLIGRDKSPRESAPAKRKANARGAAGKRPAKRALVVDNAFRLDGADISIVADEV